MYVCMYVCIYRYIHIHIDIYRAGNKNKKVILQFFGSYQKIANNFLN